MNERDDIDLDSDDEPLYGRDPDDDEDPVLSEPDTELYEWHEADSRHRASARQWR